MSLFSIASYNFLARTQDFIPSLIVLKSTWLYFGFHKSQYSQKVIFWTKLSCSFESFAEFNIPAVDLWVQLFSVHQLWSFSVRFSPFARKFVSFSLFLKNEHYLDSQVKICFGFLQEMSAMVPTVPAFS